MASESRRSDKAKILKTFPSMNGMGMMGMEYLSIERGAESGPGSITLDEALDKAGVGAGTLWLVATSTAILCLDSLQVAANNHIVGCSLSEWGSPNENIVILLSSSVFYGQILGLAASMLTADGNGRRLPVILGLAFSIVGGVVCTVSWTVWALIVGRVLSGFGTGLSQVSIFATMTETITGKHRFRYTATAFGVASTLPSVLMQCLLFLTLDVYGWRKLVAILVFLCGLVFIVSLYSPLESPRHLMSVVGDVPAADRLISKLAVQNGVALSQLSIRSGSSAGGVTFKELFGATFCSLILLYPCWGFVSASPYLLNIAAQPNMSCNYSQKMLLEDLPVSLLKLCAVSGLLYTLELTSKKLTAAKYYFLSFACHLLLLYLLMYLDRPESSLMPSIAQTGASIFAWTGYAYTYAATSELMPSSLRVTGHALLVILCKVGMLSAFFWDSETEFGEEIAMAAVLFLLSCFAVLLPETGSQVLLESGRKESSRKLSRSLDEEEERALIIR